MALKRPAARPRLLRFWRLALKSTLVLGFLTGITVYAARLPDRYVCLQLIDGYFNSALRFDLVDLNSGIDILDSRSQRTPFGLSSPDGKSVAMLQPSKPGSTETDLVITHKADPTDQPETVVVQKGIAEANSVFNRFRNMRWSADSARLAYLWAGQDRQMYLSVVGADGSDKQTALFPELDRASRNANEPQITINWSADHTYLNTTESSGGTGTSYRLWSAADLQAVDLGEPVVLRTGVWSPQAHQFAGIGEADDGSQQLVIWSPEGEITVPITASSDKSVDQVIWSPTGQYVALQSHQPCEAWEQCSSRWSFDIFSSDGKPVALNIDGASWDSGSTQSSNGAASVAAWSPDGSAWVFVQEHGAQPTKDVVALHVADNRYETIASNVVSDLADDMLYAPSPYRRNGPFRPASEVSQRIVLPTWQDGKIHVELSDVDGKNRTTLVQGADDILDPQFVFPGSSNHFWSFNGELVVVLWASGATDSPQREAHLTWSRPDGSDKHDIADGLESVDYLQVFQNNNESWLGYVARRGGDLSIEVAEVGTGKHYRLLDGLQNVEQWMIAPSPEGSVAALQVGASSSRFYGDSSLYMVALDGSSAHEISKEAVGRAAWSPDGSKLAFIHRASSNSTPYAQIVTTSGDVVQDVAIRQASTGQPRLYQWSQCS